MKPLADSDSEEDTVSWVAKNRELEEERKRAEERVYMHACFFTLVFEFPYWQKY